MARAQSAEADVRVLERWLQDTLVVCDVLEDDHEAVHQLRVAASAVREHRNDRADEARQQRAAAKEEEHETRAETRRT